MKSSDKAFWFHLTLMVLSGLHAIYRYEVINWVSAGAFIITAAIVLLNIFITSDESN